MDGMNSEGIRPPLMELMKSKNLGTVDGFTPQQRFFVGWAQIWRSKMRDETRRQQVLTDPHSPDRFRVIGPLVNADVFAKTFSCAEGTPMHPASSCEVW